MRLRRGKSPARLFLLALAAAMVPLAAGGTQQSQTELDEGIRLLESGELLKAVAAFSAFKQKFPEDARPYFYSGIALSEAGRLSAAALELGEAVRLAPTQLEYLVFQANVLERLKHRDLAIHALSALEKESAARRLDSAWLWLLGDVYYRLEKNQDTLRILELLGERNAGDARVDLKRGQVYVAKGELELAEDSLRKSVHKSAENPRAHFELGKILYQRNDMAAARQALLEAVGQDGRNPEYLHKLALACLSLDEVDQAIDYLKRAEPSASAFPEIYYALGNAYQRKGERVRAAQYRKRFQEFSLQQREREDQRREVGKLIAQGEKQLDEANSTGAQALFEQALAADPSNWDAHAYLAEMFVASGDWQRAQPHLLKMEELDPESAVGNYLMARYWHRSKELEKAQAYAEKVKLVRPGHAELRNLLGNIYLGLGQREKALREYEAAVRLAPDRPEFRENLERTMKQHLQREQQRE